MWGRSFLTSDFIKIGTLSSFSGYYTFISASLFWKKIFIFGVRIFRRKLAKWIIFNERIGSYFTKISSIHLAEYSSRYIYKVHLCSLLSLFWWQIFVDRICYVFNWIQCYRYNILISYHGELLSFVSIGFVVVWIFFFIFCEVHVHVSFFERRLNVRLWVRTSNPLACEQTSSTMEALLTKIFVVTTETDIFLKSHIVAKLESSLDKRNISEIHLVSQTIRNCF